MSTRHSSVIDIYNTLDKFKLKHRKQLLQKHKYKLKYMDSLLVIQQLQKKIKDLQREIVAGDILLLKLNRNSVPRQ
jgi:hypothetical protein